MINLTSIVRPCILNLKPYSSARDEFSEKDGVFLDANENPYGQLNRYPDPFQYDLKQKLAELKGIDVNNIFIGNGSDEIIDLAYRIFCTPGRDKALTFFPTYGMYQVSAAINNVELIKLPLNLKFQIDISELKLYLEDSNIKLIFICSPNNPTGNLISKSSIDYLIKNFKGIVIIDEAYIDFADSDSFIPSINQSNNVIVSQTFSKAWGLAAARVGVAYANKEIVSYYNKVKPPYNLSAMNQKAALDALAKLDDYNENIKMILSEKQRLYQALSKMNLIIKIYPSDANFLLVRVDKATELYNSLIVRKIITRNRSSQIENCIRISIGTPEENNKLITALKSLQ